MTRNVEKSALCRKEGRPELVENKEENRSMGRKKTNRISTENSQEVKSTENRVKEEEVTHSVETSQPTVEKTEEIVESKIVNEDEVTHSVENKMVKEDEVTHSVEKTNDRKDQSIEKPNDRSSRKSRKSNHLQKSCDEKPHCKHLQTSMKSVRGRRKLSNNYNLLELSQGSAQKLISNYFIKTNPPVRQVDQDQLTNQPHPMMTDHPPSQ